MGERDPMCNLEASKSYGVRRLFVLVTFIEHFFSA